MCLEFLPTHTIDMREPEWPEAVKKKSCNLLKDQYRISGVEMVWTLSDCSMRISRMASTSSRLHADGKHTVRLPIALHHLQVLQGSPNEPIYPLTYIFHLANTSQ